MIDQIIEDAISEDLGEGGDVTSDALFTQECEGEAIIKSKGHGILSGAILLQPLFIKINPDIKMQILTQDSEPLEPGKIICILNGPVNGILAGERIALNFLQHLSGIATLTSRYVKEISHTEARLLDTRKTTPTLRFLEKKAVIHGGGYNHRFGLFDMILIKDTHVKRCGGPAEALEKALKFRKKNKHLKIEIEVQSIDEFYEAVKFLPDRIMLDNMSTADMKICVEHIKNTNIAVQLEASGNVTLETISDIAETGVHFISSGAITHSAPALDIHLVIK